MSTWHEYVSTWHEYVSTWHEYVPTWRENVTAPGAAPLPQPLDIAHIRGFCIHKCTSSHHPISSFMLGLWDMDLGWMALQLSTICEGILHSQIHSSPSAHQPISPSAHQHQPTSPSAHQPLIPSAHHPISPSAHQHQPTNPSAHHPLIPSAQQPIRPRFARFGFPC